MPILKATRSPNVKRKDNHFIYEVKYPDNGKTTTVLFSHPGTFTSWGEYVVSLNFGGPFFLYACNTLIDTKQFEVYLQPK